MAYAILSEEIIYSWIPGMLFLWLFGTSLSAIDWEKGFKGRKGIVN